MRAVNGYIRLEHGSSPYSIELSAELVPRLSAEIAAATRAGRELGGLLTGSFPRSAGVTIRINDFVLTSGWEGGESRFKLTAEQRARLSTTRRELIESNQIVVGFFRSHLRRDSLALSADDKRLLTTEFGKAIYTALLIRGKAPQKGAFFVPNDDGILPSGAAPKSLQFDASAFGGLEVEGSRASEFYVETTSMPAGGGGPVRVVPRRMFWAFGVLVLCMCIAVAVWTPSAARLLGFDGGGLGLKVGERSGVLDIEWNRRAADVEHANSATMTIDDGSVRRTMNLSRAELQTGKISYRPQSDHVAVRMLLELPEATELAQSADWRLKR